MMTDAFTGLGSQGQVEVVVMPTQETIKQLLSWGKNVRAIIEVRGTREQRAGFVRHLREQDETVRVVRFANNAHRQSFPNELMEIISDCLEVHYRVWLKDEVRR